MSARAILFFIFSRMQLLFYAPQLTAPTLESLQKYAEKRLSKLNRILPKLSSDKAIRISVQRQKHMFVLSIELAHNKPIYIQVEDPNLYKAIDNAVDVLRRTLRKDKEKRRYSRRG